MTAGIKTLKDNLSHFDRRVEAGERLEALVAEGVVVPVAEAGDPTEGEPVWT